MRSAPLIIGHRGASAVAPENTLAAFSRALADGADGVEFDVRLSRDGIPVVIHDANLKRTAGIDVAVAAVDAHELQQYDVGKYFYPIDSKNQATRVPLLSQVLELFQQTNALLYLEMKADGENTQALSAAVVREIHKSQLKRRVIVSSFDLAVVAEIKRIDAGIRTAALFEPKLSRPLATLRRLNMLEVTRRLGADEIALHYSLVTRRVAAKARRLQLPIVVWTVDEIAWLERSKDFGIKAVITNQPGAMVRRRSSTSAASAEMSRDDSNDSHLYYSQHDI